MQLNLLKKPCPVCKTKIKSDFFGNNEEIIRCPHCGALMTENPKRRLVGSFFGIVFPFALWTILKLWMAISLVYLFVFFFICFFFWMQILKFKVIKKDLVIKNKQTNKISYVNQSDWNEIVKNSADKENVFEIVEVLK